MRRLRAQRGLTLAELMIAVALIGIGILAVTGSYGGIHRAIQSSKGHTVATNLAQQAMQILMQKSYYEILVTTAPAYNSDFNPTLPYDPSIFPPTTSSEGGMSFTRYTFVQVVQENSGVIEVLPPGTPDTGMRQITIYVEWQSPMGSSYVVLQNVINNPNTVMSNAVLSGQVLDAVTGGPVATATVDVAENVGWRDSANATGNYSIHLSPGTFNLIASAPGYYTQYVLINANPNATLTQNFSLSPISSGTVQGTAWVNTNLLISQVVASTITTTDTEYIELYNPTSSPINMGTGDPSSGSYWANWKSFFYYYDKSGNNSFSYLTYISSYVPPNSYYLIANTTTVAVGGVSRQADAIYGTPAYSYRNGSSGNNFISPSHMIQSNQAGGLIFWINDPVNGWTIINRVGWQSTSQGQSAPNVTVEPTNGTGTGIASAGGLTAGEQFVRKTDTSTVNTSFGRAYDGSNNTTDFVDYITISALPNNTTISQLPVTGVPATGAIISINDGMSSSVQATLTGSPAYAWFSVPGVATGTWTAFIDSGTVSAEIDNVTVTSGAITVIPNSATTPIWPTAGLDATVLSSPRLLGMISGTVTDAAGALISPSIVVSAGGVSVTAGPAGNYSIRLATGIYNVVANAGNANPSYESVTRSQVTVNLADATASIDFHLSQSGRVNGWITRDGVNPLPGVSVVALDSNGDAQDTEVSGSNGSFTLVNLTTGSYIVEPVLDPKETKSPANASVTVTAGATVSAGTFTVTGAMGTLIGSVKVSGKPIQTGVLVVVSTGTISTPPPTLNQAALAGRVYYANSSQEDGTYSLEIRGSTTTTYNAAAFYMHFNGNTPLISTAAISGITITAGQTTSGINFSW